MDGTSPATPEVQTPANNVDADVQPVEAPTSAPEPVAEPAKYNYLTGEPKPREVKQPQIDADEMGEDEVERLQQKYAVEKSALDNRANAVKTDVLDFLTSNPDAEVYRPFKEEVERVAMLEGAEQFTTESLFYLVGGKKLVESLVDRTVRQLQMVDSSNSSNAKPNPASATPPSSSTDFSSMPRDEFRKLKAKVLQGESLGL